MANPLQRSQWLRVSLGSLACTFLFMVFFAAIPSAIINWSDQWPWVQAPETFGVLGLGKRLRDLIIVGWYGAITPVTFVAFSLWQRLHPVNADADEPKRDAGGYR
ncbi:MAG TPA: hypothetical protein VF519_01685 [Mycobacteriales bacterium]|jgi:hypothetical protein